MKNNKREVGGKINLDKNLLKSNFNIDFKSLTRPKDRINKVKWTKRRNHLSASHQGYKAQLELFLPSFKPTL